MRIFVQDAFRWLHEHSRAGWAILLLYAVAVTFPHEEVQSWVGELAKWMGRANLYRIAAAIGLVTAGILSSIVVPALRQHPAARLVGGYWAATLLLILGAWGLLTANNTELVHYPQYFVPGAILMAITLSPFESLAWITVTAGLDECYQYWGLHGGWGVPFDFNDIFMDLLGGALGVVFALAIMRCQRASPPDGMGAFLRRTFSKPCAALLLAVVLSGLALGAAGKMLLYQDEHNQTYWFALSRLKVQSFWFFDETWGPKTFHTLSPLEGPVLLILTLAFYAVLNRKLKIGLADGPA